MSAKYSACMKTMWMSAFYASVIPFGIVISIIGLILVYFIDKWLLLRRYTRPHLLNAKLNKEMIEYLEFVPLFMSIGSLIFHLKVYDTDVSHSWDILAIIFSSTNFIFPSASINKWLFKLECDVSNTVFYKDALINFPTVQIINIIKSYNFI